MATVHSTVKARAGRNRSKKSKVNSSTSRRVGAISATDREVFRTQLLSHVRTLRTAMFVATTCGDALRYQAADNGIDVAAVLRIYCGSKLYGAIQEAGMLLALLDGKTSIDPESDEIGSLAEPENNQVD